MPRDATGLYTLPTGNPVVTDTIIETQWANPTLADIAEALTNSLDRYGRGGMLDSFPVIDGTVAKPGLAFISQASLGIYRESSNVLGIAVAGAAAAKFSDTAITLAKPVTAQQGIAVTGDLSATGALSVGSATVAGLVNAASATIGGTLAVAGIATHGSPLLAPVGSAGAPSFTFSAEPITGIYSPGPGQLSASTTGVERLRVANAGVTAYVPFYAQAGSAAAPAFSFAADTDTGLYSPGPGVLAVVTDGVERVRWDASGAAGMVPAGTILDFGGATPPAGYLLCDGSAVSRTTYATLFAAIGTTWGAGDGSTTFNVPDLRRRATIGSGGTVVVAPGGTVGSTGGAETMTLAAGNMPVHNHGVTDTGHVHGLTDNGHSHGYVNPQLPSAGTSAYQNGPQAVTWRIDNIAAGTTSTDACGLALQSAQTGIQTQNAGGGVAFGLMQPSAVVTKIIKA